MTNASRPNISLISRACENGGIIALNGPVRFKDSPAFRGMSIYTVDVEEARAYALEDPAVKAGWFEVAIDSWWLPSTPVTVGDRVDIEI